ncbi:phosphomannomutase (plasmid) [Thioclava sp. 'Guangxiensis']|uniref:phosphomannomutase n=1 Tax=Thioclava sp. 'Guangxiensis' TaxID=3149044 RepID=UPI0032C43B62
MAPAFGTSGLRGLVTELTPDLVSRYIRAFLASCPQGRALYIGRDLRPSSPAIADVVIKAAQAAGIDTVECGAQPTPALAMVAMEAGCGAVMVTGSHIPADRNGLKFYIPSGEISKADEAAIKAAYEVDAAPAGAVGTALPAPDTAKLYNLRYVKSFGETALAGLRIGVYRHSSVARDAMEEILRAMGAEVVALAHSDSFVPVDTEAVDPATRDQLAQWCATHGLDAIVSTDGDADRPMVTDARGVVIPGDVLGVITARLLGAKVICTPVSSNDMVRQIPEFTEIHLTKIGSPFVIAAMEAVLQADPATKVVGFEANGGFLLGFQAFQKSEISPLMTRDSLLPILAPLVAARQAGTGLAALVAALPPCFTAADRLQEIDRAKAAHFLADLVEDAQTRAEFFTTEGAIDTVDLTDGLRVNFVSGEVVHLRPSGNAPEFRVYAQAADPAQAQSLVMQIMQRVDHAIG